MVSEHVVQLKHNQEAEQYSSSRMMIMNSFFVCFVVRALVLAVVRSEVCLRSSDRMCLLRSCIRTCTLECTQDTSRD